MPPAGFEPTISAGERQKTDALDRATTGTGRRTNYPNLFCYKTVHVSGFLPAHHQEFSTVHLALVIFMQV